MLRNKITLKTPDTVFAAGTDFVARNAKCIVMLSGALPAPQRPSMPTSLGPAQTKATLRAGKRCASFNPNWPV